MVVAGRSGVIHVVNWHGSLVLSIHGMYKSHRAGLCNWLPGLERSQSERKRVAKSSGSILRSAPLSATTLLDEGKKPQVPPLRYAPVGMTILLWELALALVNGTSSRWHNKIVIPTEAQRSGEPDLRRVQGGARRWKMRVDQFRELARLLVPLTRAKANSHNKIVIPTGAQRSGGTCGFFPSSGSVAADKGKTAARLGRKSASA